MKYTKEELLQYAKESGAKIVETYKYTDRSHRLHTDFIEYIGDCFLNIKEIENLPFNEVEEIDADVHLMDKEEYANTIEANCDSTWDDAGLTADDTILVIVVR